MSPSDGRTIGRVGAVMALGFALMFVGHFLAMAGWSASQGMSYRPLYWWGYLVVYPLAGAILARLDVMRGWPAAGCLCLAPVAYFTMLGLRHGTWTASDAALVGALLAAGVTGIVASRVTPSRPASSWPAAP